MLMDVSTEPNEITSQLRNVTSRIFGILHSFHLQS